MSLYVFLGPTMPVEAAREICEAIYLPPVAMGDLYALEDARPSTVAIIDGTFQNAPAVWHKEILYALSRGTRVIGASSMGALRAAELHQFGMEGVGAIYEAFRDGIYNDDDEVAVMHAAREHGYRPLSEAMVNIRAGLREALDRGLIGSKTRDELVRQAKRVFYPERSWPALFKIGLQEGLPSDEMGRLETYVRSEKPNAKRADATLLLNMLATKGPPDPHPRPAKTLPFEATWFWNKMVESEKQRRAANRVLDDGPSTVKESAVVRHVRLFEAERVEVLRSALLLYFLEREAERLGELVDGPEGGAPSVAPTPDPSEQLQRVYEHLTSTLRGEIDRYIPVELQRRGNLKLICHRVAKKWDHLTAAGTTEPTLDGAGVSEETFWRWFSERTGLAPVEQGDVDELVARIGLSSADELLREGAAEYLWCQGAVPSAPGE
jgi:hypothetical protein